MSPAATFHRVYSQLKAELAVGRFAPGDRLDPSHLAEQLFASVTPVREALHRLTGERVVESWAQEGFHVPLVTDASLRDLYVWSLELINLITRAAERASRPEAIAYPAQDVERLDSPAGLDEIFVAIAARSPNHEHRAAVANLVDRSALARNAERLTIADEAEVAALARALDRADWSAVRRGLVKVHAARRRAVPATAARLRPREASAKWSL